MEEVKSKGQTLRCPEEGCNMTITVTGGDTREAKEFMELHKHTKHWNIDRLPNEILIKMFSYVVPDCKDCFRQQGYNSIENILSLVSA